jgi:hypothetical protein
VSASNRRQREVIDSLRRGTVPSHGLGLLAVGLDRFSAAVDDELDAVAAGGAVFKAVRGEYGSGKTFFSRWLTERARKQGFATSEVQISETETPLHRLETVYRRIVESLTTDEFPPSALGPIVDGWFFTLEADALAAGADPDALEAAVGDLMEKRLAEVARSAPGFAAALRGYHQAMAAGDAAAAQGLLAWLAGQPHVAASVKRAAGIKGSLDHFGAFGFLQGLLVVLRDSGFSGLVVVLDEVETLQRVRGDVRDKALNALRQLIDEVQSGRFPGLYLLVTGTPAFFDGTQGAQRLPPLAQRLATDFSGDPRFDNPRAVQIRLPGFDQASLGELGRKARDLYCEDAAPRVVSVVDDVYLADFARALAGEMGGKVGVAPRVFLKKLVADVLDRVDQFEDFDPRRDYQLTVRRQDLTSDEWAAVSVDDVDLDLDE